MATYTLGKDAVITVNGNVLTNCKDVTVTLSKGEADITTRGNNGWKATVGTLKECSVEFESIFNPEGNAVDALLEDSFLNDTELECSILTASDGTGPTGKWVVTSYNREEPLEDAIKHSVTLKLVEFTEWLTGGASS